LSGNQSAVDALSLGLSDTNVLGGGTGFTSNTVSLNSGTFLSGSASESFLFHAVVNGTATTQTVTVNGSAAGISGSAVIAQLNEGLGAAGLETIVATKDSNGYLQFSSTNAFNVKDTASTATLITGGTATGESAISNATNYVLASSTASFSAPTGSTTETLTFQQNGQTITTTLNATNSSTLAKALATINAATSQYGIYAVANSAGTGIELQSSNTFSIDSATETALGSSSTSPASPTNTGAVTANADTAITAINAAIQQLGLTQGVVGAGENTLNYAINLAQSQITNFSGEESSIKDANVAQEAANLSKSQVLTQTAVAALAQANSEPQAILKLLQ
jgi:flagellin